MVSEPSYTKHVVIMIIIYKVSKPSYKITRKTWGQLTLYLISEYMYGNPMNLMIQWWKINLSYNPYNISMDEINTIRRAFGTLGYYGSTCQATFFGNNTYIGHRRAKRDNVTPIQGPILNNDTKFHYKIDPLNTILQILYGKLLKYYNQGFL